jgi:hypothetical protein
MISAYGPPPGPQVGHIFYADIKVAPTHSWVFEGDHRLW